MNWKVIKTEAQYQKAVKRAMQIFHANEGTPEGDEVALLLVLIRDYEDRHITIPDLDPIEVIITFFVRIYPIIPIQEIIDEQYVPEHEKEPEIIHHPVV